MVYNGALTVGLPREVGVFYFYMVKTAIDTLHGTHNSKLLPIFAKNLSDNVSG